MPKENELISLAGEIFTGLNGAESMMLRSAAAGEETRCGTAEADFDASNDPGCADRWDRERSIRAEVLRWVCVDGGASGLVDPRGVRVCHARVVGRLDLSLAKVPFPLSLVRCSLMDGCDLMQSSLPRLELTGSYLGAMNFQRMSLTGSLLMSGARCLGHRMKMEAIRLGGEPLLR